MCSIVYYKESRISNNLEAHVFGHEDKVITIHIDTKGIGTMIHIGNHMDARALAAMLIEAAAAVDPKPAAQEDGANG